jgi:large subunit ribosomal protein L19
MANFRVGDTIAVFIKPKEGKRARRQIFEGIVIGFSGRGETRTFTIRRIGSAGVGIEQTWPVCSPNIEKISVKQKGRFKRAKLYWLRQKKSKKRR